MKLSRPLAAVAVLAMLALSPAVAFAQDQTGPESEACVAAQAALDETPEPRGVASDFEQQDQRAKEALAVLPTTASDGSDLVATEEEIERLEGKLDHPLAQEKIDAIRALLDARATAATAAQDLATDQERFAGEQEAVAAAEAARDAACAPPEDEGNTPPAALTPEQAVAEINAFECEGGPAEASGRLSDMHLALLDRLPDDTSSEARGTVWDAYTAKMDELNYCYPDGTTPPPEVTDPDGDGQNGANGQAPGTVEGGDAQANAGDVIVNVPGGTSGFSQLGADDVPTGGVETGGGPA